MKKIATIALIFILSPIVIYAASIATTAVVGTLADTDRIPIGRPGGTTAYTTTPAQIRANFRAYSTAQTTRNAAFYAHRTAFQAYTAVDRLKGSSFITYTTVDRVTDNTFKVYTTGRVKLGKFTNLSTSKVFTIGNHGIYMNGVSVVAW